MATHQALHAETRSGRTALLAAGDIVVFFLFAGIGRLSHGKGAGLEDIVAILSNALPFAGSWLVSGALLGAYRSERFTQPRSLLVRTVFAWALALFPGVVIRMLVLREAFPALSFAITTFIFVTVFLCGWRLLFSWLLRRGARNGD